MRPAVLFDLDGVLADSRATITASVAQALVERGHGAHAAGEVERLIGPPLRSAFADLLALDPDGEEVTALVDAYRSRYRLALCDTAGFPGMAEALDELAAAGFRLGVATSKPLPFAEPVLDVLGIRERFEVVEGPLLDGTEDKAVTLERALAALGPGAVALVGDRRYDVAAAKAHGLLAVGVTWGIGSRQELTDAGVDVLVENPADLVHWLLGTPRPFAGLPPVGG
ncbi:MAG: phosphoglycolate phosphatase [Solirubrobacteraceae bacterium]|nr:phosphoglycolate phosphatase [Solirubrobacteraceae bacterium]